MTQQAPFEPRRVVVDASVAAKWLLREEDLATEADQLIDDHAKGEVVLYAPTDILGEVVSALRKAVLNRRISADDLDELVEQWLGSYRSRLLLAKTEHLVRLAVQRSLRLGITLYDAVYLVLADETDAEFVTADSRLLRALGGQWWIATPLGVVEQHEEESPS